MEIMATNRELLILRDWLNQKKDFEFNPLDEYINISFNVNSREIKENGSYYITDLPRKYKGER